MGRRSVTAIEPQQERPPGLGSPANVAAVALIHPHYLAYFNSVLLAQALPGGPST
ncbi:MAG: hypothetical protein U0835_09260 [Isosphaeraceae bacterium]